MAYWYYNTLATDEETLMGQRLRAFMPILLSVSVVVGWLVHWGLPLPFSPVVSDRYTRQKSPQRLIFLTAKEFEGWWSISTTEFPPPPPPTIDFDQESVIVAAMGSCPSSGYDIRIDSIRETFDSVDVRVSESTPGLFDSVRPAGANPYDMVKVKKLGKRIRFIDAAWSWRLAGLCLATGALALVAVRAWTRRRAMAREAAVRGPI
jgi:hypothetical protein